MELSGEEGRVLGCLVEKQLTTPQQYPMTENALIAACNQTTNRDPVVHYDVSTVRMAVRALREKELVRTVHRTGERTEKHRHQLDSALGLSPAEVALLAVLLLRGPQTPGELRSRSERMHPFGSIEEVEQALDALARRDVPLVARLERQPGHKEARYRELLVSTDAAGTRPTPQPERVVAAARPTPVEELADEVAGLRAEVADLRAEVARLATVVRDAAAQGPSDD